MPNSTPFEDYLASGESSLTAGSGSLFQETRWTPAAICLTDRRILFVPEDGGFVDVARGQVLTLRSRPRTRRTTEDALALAGLIGSAVLAGIAAIATLAIGGGLLVPVLAALAAGGTLATISVVQNDVRLEAVDVYHTLARIDRWLTRHGGIPAPPRDRRREAVLATVVDERPVLRWGTALCGTAGAAGLLLLGAWVALGLAAVVALGSWTAIEARERRRELRRRGQSVRRERTVSLQLLDGRSVEFRVDAEATIDRELSRLTAGPTAVPLAAADAVGPADEQTADAGASTGP